jgi:hypothetical protein
MNSNFKRSIKPILLELLVYAVLVFAYYLLVLRLLGDWLNDLFQGRRKAYAVLSLLFILGQGILLELVTRWLLSWVGSREGEE